MSIKPYVYAPAVRIRLVLRFIHLATSTCSSFHPSCDIKRRAEWIGRSSVICRASATGLPSTGTNVTYLYRKAFFNQDEIPYHSLVPVRVLYLRRGSVCCAVYDGIVDYEYEYEYECVLVRTVTNNSSNNYYYVLRAAFRTRPLGSKNKYIIILYGTPMSRLRVRYSYEYW